jgi:hypothetical protein
LHQKQKQDVKEDEQLIRLSKGATENALIKEHFSPLGDYIAIPVAFSNYYFYFHFASNHILT